MYLNGYRFGGLTESEPNEFSNTRSQLGRSICCQQGGTVVCQRLRGATLKYWDTDHLIDCRQQHCTRCASQVAETLLDVTRLTNA